MPVDGLVSKAVDEFLSMDRWKEFVGEEVDIREYQIVGTEERLCYIRRGTVRAVSEAPPGLILEDVETRIRKESLFDPSAAPIRTSTVNDAALREVEEKLVAFEDISEVELTELATKADEEMG